MNELCNNFELYPISDVVSITGNVVVFKEGSVSVKLVADNIDLRPTASTSTSGTLHTTESDVLVEKVSEAVARRYANVRSCLLLFKKLTGETVVVGSLTYPAKVYIIPLLSRDRVKIRCNSLRSPL